MLKLYIDDLRYPPDSSWALARDIAGAIAYVLNNGCPDEISFDYCLQKGQNIMPFIEWLIEQDKKQTGFIPDCFVFDSHSSSAFGTQMIYDVLNTYLQSRKNTQKDK